MDNLSFCYAFRNKHPFRFFVQAGFVECGKKVDFRRLGEDLVPSSDSYRVPRNNAKVSFRSIQKSIVILSKIILK